MTSLTKRSKAIREKVDTTKAYAVIDAFQLLKECSSVKFDESVEVAVNLGVDPRKSDQAIRGSTVLPRGTGKSVTVAVFADGDQAEAAKAAGAEYVGMQDLVEQIQGGLDDFGVVRVGRHY